MDLFSKIYDKFFIKQWSIGLSYGTKEDVLNHGIDKLNFTWIPNHKASRLIADPFLARNQKNELFLFYEDFKYEEWAGKIRMSKLDSHFSVIEETEVLNTGSHLSYPYVYEAEGNLYIMPEASKGGQHYAYEIDFDNKRLLNRKLIFPDIQLLDASITFHEGKYWLFATHRGIHSNSQLHIYFSDKWDGPYAPHQLNPVKDNADGSRPAGDFVIVDGQLYRPTQNCKSYYGKSITINRVLKLNESSFEEVAHIEIVPPNNSHFNYAIHTINFSGNVIVIDGLRRIFRPMTQIKSFLKRKLKSSGVFFPSLTSLFAIIMP
jgi:hypothetical protein